MCDPEEHGKRRVVLKQISSVRHVSSHSPAAMKKLDQHFHENLHFQRTLILDLFFRVLLPGIYITVSFVLPFFFKYMPLKLDLKHLQVKSFEIKGGDL